MAVAQIASDGWPTHATQLSRTLAHYVDGGYHIEALAIHECAYRAAGVTGDRAGQGAALVEAG